MFTVALIEPQALIREALRRFLNVASEIMIVADTPTVAEMLPLLPRSLAQVVVLSLDASGGEPDAVLTPLVNAGAPVCGALVLTSDREPERAVHLIALGARGVV